MNCAACRPNIWIINHYASDMYENLEGRHYSFAEKLIQERYKVNIICASTIHNSENIVETGKEGFTVKMAGDIPFVFVKSAPYKTNSFDRIWNMFTFARNLVKLKKKLLLLIGKPDLIIASSPQPLACKVGLKLGRQLRTPVVVEIRDLWPEAIFVLGKVKSNSLLGRMLTAGEHHIYKNANAIIFTKEGDVDYIKEKKWDADQGGDIDLNKCFYINNGVHLARFDQQAWGNSFEDEDLDDDLFRVIYTGSIREVNNVGQILDCAVLLKNNPKIRFLIYGNGNQLESLKKRVKDQQLCNVVLKGFVERKYIPFVLSHSSVNLLNYSQSKYNWSRGNSSRKLFEYMASGKPIISTVKMGYSLIKRYSCGVELNEYTPDKLAEAVMTLYHAKNEDYLEMCDNARKAASDFDFNVLSKKLINVINYVLGNNDYEKGEIEFKL
ncbi:MAG: glycosyltransferase family 4 protein [Clostridiales bacterium]|nr:glycosyltransferase family 4 protein [Clostridiales bacterium]